MKQFFTQYMKDFSAHFVNLNAYILLGGYCLLSFFSAIYLGDYFLRETSVLNSYFAMQPIILMLIIPALTMRSWADEIKSGTLELLLTQPISYLKIVLAKFFATYSFFLLMILFTLPFLFISNRFSILDIGATYLGYLGILLCGALFTAIGCMVSIFNRNIVLSYVSTIFVIFILTQINFDSFTLNSVSISLSGLNFENNFSAFLGGVFYLGNILYFILSICLILWLNVVVLTYYRSTSVSDKKRLYGFIFLLLLIFYSGNLGFSFICDNAIDATDEHQFTLSDESTSYLAQIDKRIDISLYESKNKREDANSSYALYAEAVERIFKLIEKNSNGAIRIEFIRVEPFSTQERSLIHDNITYKEDNLGNKVFLAADFSDNDGNHQTIPSFVNLRQNLLEADILRVIRQFGHAKQDVALLASQSDLEQMNSFHTSLKEFYNVTMIPESATFIPPVYSSVIVINPSLLSSELILALEQYVLNGGSLVIFAEPTMPKNNMTVLKKFLEHFGIMLHPEKIVDAQVNKDTPGLGFAFPTDKNLWQDVRSVLVNDSGSLSVSSKKDYTATPILTLNNQIIGAGSVGSFVSDHLLLAAQTPNIEAVSVKEGKVLFFYDSDMLKDYLYVSDETKAQTFYDIIPVADNFVFLLRLMAYATDSPVEKYLTYHHYISNSTSIGNNILSGIKERYATQTKQFEEQIETLQNKQNNIRNTLVQKGYASVKNIGNLSDIAQRLDETQDNLRRLKAQILGEYQTVIATLTIILVLVIPVFLLLLMALWLMFFNRVKLQKLRRLIQDAKTL